MRLLAAASYLLVLGMFAAFACFGQPGYSRQDGPSFPRFRADRAMADLRAIDALTHASGGRAIGTPGNAAVRRYVGARLLEAGLQVREQPFKDTLGGDMTNLIGELPGTREEAILVCAHHDVEGNGPGAVGGTSGLAMMLELARSAAEARGLSGGRSAVKVRGEARRLMFATWDGESLGCAGSTHFVRSLPARERSLLRAVISLDSVGWKGGDPVLHTMPYQDRFGLKSIAPDWLVLGVAGASREAGEPLAVGDRWLGIVYQVLVRQVNVGYYSDDRPFLAGGIPALYLANFSLTSSFDGAGTGKDTLEQVGADKLAAAGLSVEAALADLAGAESYPEGEGRYLIFAPWLVRPFRLTADQIRLLAALTALPGALVLLVRRRPAGGGAAAPLFAASVCLFLIGSHLDPILFATLFAPSLLAAPLLAVTWPSAVGANALALMPPALFGVLLAPVYLSGSANLVTASTGELWVFAGLLGIGLVQASLHLRRSRPAPAAPDLSSTSP